MRKRRKEGGGRREKKEEEEEEGEGGGEGEGRREEGGGRRRMRRRRRRRRPIRSTPGARGSEIGGNRPPQTKVVYRQLLDPRSHAIGPRAHSFDNGRRKWNSLPIH